MQEQQELRAWWNRKVFLTTKAHFLSLTNKLSSGQALSETEQTDKERCMQVLSFWHEKYDRETHAAGVAYDEMVVKTDVLFDWIFENSYPGESSDYSPLTAEQTFALAIICREILKDDDDKYLGPRELLAFVERFMHNVHGGVKPPYRSGTVQNPHDPRQSLMSMDFMNIVQQEELALSLFEILVNG